MDAAMEMAGDEVLGRGVGVTGAVMTAFLTGVALVVVAFGTGFTCVGGGGVGLDDRVAGLAQGGGLVDVAGFGAGLVDVAGFGTGLVDVAGFGAGLADVAVASLGGALIEI